MVRLQALRDWFAQPLHFFMALLSLVPLARLLLFIANYGWSMPYGDQWIVGSRAAVAAVDGQLTLAFLTSRMNDHRIFFTRLLTGLTTWLTGWNVRVELGISLLLVCLIFVLLIVLLRRTRPDLLVAALLPLSVLLFSIMRETNWYSGLHSFWNFAPLFTLSALLVLSAFGIRWQTLIAAAVLSLCATYSLSNGLLAWGLVLALLVLSGWRVWGHYLFWIGATVGGVLLYLFGNEFVFVSEGGRDNLQLHAASLDPLAMLQTLLVYLGRPFSERLASLDLTMAIGGLGLALLAFNLVYLWFQRDERRWLPVWIGVLGYGLGSGLLLALGRAAVGVEVAIGDQYIAASIYFWIALAVFMAAVIWRTARLKRLPGRLLLYGNLAAAVVLVLCYLHAENATLARISRFWDRGFDLTAVGTLRPDEQCVLDYRFTRDLSCARRNRAIGSYVDALAARRLTIFAGQPTVSILPPAYQPDAAVIIEAADPWLAVHIRDWLLAGVPDERIWFAVEDSADIMALPRPPQHILDADADLPMDSPQVWHIRAGAGSGELALTGASAGYVSIFAQRLLEPAALTITGYQQLPEAPRLLFRLGDDAALQGWQFRDSVQVSRCQTVTLETLWSVEARQTFDYSLTVTLADVSGVGAARSDGDPAGLPMSQWQPGQLYLDRRGLTIPCDLPPGEYPLLVGLYDYRDDRSLPVTTADGASQPGLIYLTTLFVE